jgi:hypothetical protein
MRFMMMVKSNEQAEAGLPPSPEMMAAVEKYTEEMIKAGVVLDTGGLLPSAMGARIRLTGGKLIVSDGPFAEAKELIGGYAIIRAASKQEAIESGKSFMAIHMDVHGPSYESEMEIRQLADFEPELTPER